MNGSLSPLSGPSQYYNSCGITSYLDHLILPITLHQLKLVWDNAFTVFISFNPIILRPPPRHQPLSFTFLSPRSNTDFLHLFITTSCHLQSFLAISSSKPSQTSPTLHISFKFPKPPKWCPVFLTSSATSSTTSPAQPTTSLPRPRLS